MNELALFSGNGGGILGGRLLGWHCVGAVERTAFRVRRLMQRQNEGHLPPFPIWDDVRTFDGRPWRGVADMVSGGFPCKGISVAGDGSGLDHEESTLWSDQARVIGQSKAPAIWIENSPALTVRGGVRVIGDLAEMGYDCRWGVISAADAIWTYGTPCLDHLRERIWIAGTLADADRAGRENRTAGSRNDRSRRPGAEPERRGEGSSADSQPRRSGFDQGGRGIDNGAQSGNDGSGSDSEIGGRTVCGRTPGQERHPLRPDLPAEADPHAHDPRRIEQRTSESAGAEHEAAQRGSWWAVEPGMGRMAHGVAGRVDRLEAIGDGQVPAVVKFAWEILTQ